MRYTDDRETNERQKSQTGEREVVTSGELFDFLGGDNDSENTWEMLLDILNQQYPIADAVRDIKEHSTKGGVEMSSLDIAMQYIIDRDLGYDESIGEIKTVDDVTRLIKSMLKAYEPRNRTDEENYAFDDGYDAGYLAGLLNIDLDEMQ